MSLLLATLQTNVPTSSSGYHRDHYYIPEALAIGVATAMLLPTAGAPLAVVAITTVSAISAGAAVHSMAVFVLDYAFYGVDTAGNHANLDLAS
jgi:hypothetical protein